MRLRMEFFTQTSCGRPNEVSAFLLISSKRASPSSEIVQTITMARDSRTTQVKAALCHPTSKFTRAALSMQRRVMEALALQHMHTRGQCCRILSVI